MAEFYRRNPGLLAMQDDVSIRLSHIQVEVEADCLDVRTDEQALAAGIATDRLLSSEADEKVRYQECRELADEVEAADGQGIAYPSAAMPTADAWNLVLFGPEAPGSWTSLAVAGIHPLPLVPPSEVSILP
jgi:hypothetical protein